MRGPILLLGLVLAALLAALAAKALLVQPPPLRAHSEPGEFDAARAKARLALVLGDQSAHPTDTIANDRVRERIVALLHGLGLKPLVRDQVACNELYKERGVSCARVRNVVALLGPPRGRALLLSAHYDSSAVGPGASDAGIGVATLLEVASLLKDCQGPFVSSEVETRRQQGPSTSLGATGNCFLRRPVILLYNEGEELGLVGARAFLADPLSRSVDSLVNLEARGVRGPVNMFETSRPNGPALAAFASSVARPLANSLSTDVYRLMPNYTDVNSFAERGWLTLNLAPVGNETRYHSPGDDVAALDPATLQHMGDQTLALARALADGRPGDGGERIFMDVAGRTLIVLPLIAGVLLLAALLLAFGFVAVRRGRLGRAAAVVLGTIAGSAALSWLVLAALGLVRGGMFWRAYPLWTHLAGYAAAMLVAVALLATLGARADRTQLRASFWLVFLLIGAGIGLVAPGGIVFFLFPPLLVLAGIAARRWWAPAERLGPGLAIMFLYATWGAMLGLLEELMNGGPMWIFAPLGSLVALPVLIEARPLIMAAGRRAATLAAALLVLVLAAVAAAAPAYSADRQQRFVIQHISDFASGKAFWSVLNDRAPLPPAYRRAGHWQWTKLPLGDRRRWVADAPAVPGIRPPAVERVEEVRSGGERIVTLRLRANGNERITLLAPKDAKIRAAGVAGFVRPIDAAAEDGKYYLGCFGRSCEGLELQVRTASAAPIELLVVGNRRGLPATAAPLAAARPRFARPQYAPDETIAVGKTRL